MTFDGNDDKPTFPYGYKQAVDDKALFDFSLYQVKTKFQRKEVAALI